MDVEENFPKMKTDVRDLFEATTTTTTKKENK
jgi:hypothetical protein